MPWSKNSATSPTGGNFPVTNRRYRSGYWQCFFCHRFCLSGFFANRSVDALDLERTRGPMVPHMSKILAAQTATQIVADLSANTRTLADVHAALREQHQVANTDINAFEFLAEPDNHEVAGPLRGLPITVKDQISVADMPLNHGLDRFSKRPAANTAPVVQRLLDAGARVWGKTTLPPYAMDFQTFNRRTGTTRNPWDPDRTPGGSSGGGAAAVATGMSYLDIGSDLSGSLRIPAGYCGVYSLMPTDGNVDTEGLLPKGAVLANFARPGPIARAVDDLELAWSLMSDASVPATEKASYSIGYWDPAGGIVPVETEVAAIFDSVEVQLNGPGLSVSRSDLSELFHLEVYRCFGEIMGHETSALMPSPIRRLQRFWGKAAAKRSPNFLQHVHTGYRRNTKLYHRALETRLALRRAFDASWSAHDALLLPVCGVQPFTHRTPLSDRGGVRDYAVSFDLGRTTVGYFDALTAFTVPVSVMGNPAVTLPLGLDSNGLPVGGQLVGRRGAEMELLQVARRLAAALPELQNPYLRAAAAHKMATLRKDVHL